VKIGPYRVEEVLGEGGMGVVYRAVREPSGEIVALKVLHEELSRSDAFRRRFAREARAAAAVGHRHLVPVVDAGEAGGRTYLAVAYVEGRTLAARLAAEGPLPLQDVVRVALEVGEAIDAVHRAGLVHRDVKPSNVMLDLEGRALLTDFGLARGEGYSIVTRPGEVMGTLDYVAPEVVLGGDATPASDVYALGCLVYECVTGEPPFAGRSLVRLARAHVEEEPPDPGERRPGLPAGLSFAILRALAKDPRDRPGTGRAYGQLVRAGALPSRAG
jgi:serine/threonine-protein kinase